MFVQQANGVFRLFLIVAVGFALRARAEEADELKSVLVDEADLRPLVEISDEVASGIGNAADAAADQGEELELPAPIIPGLWPIPDSPPTVQPSPAAIERTPLVPARRVSTNPLLDFGISFAPRSRSPRIRGVIVGAPAHRAGVKPGDIVTTVNGVATSTITKLREALSSGLNESHLVTVGVSRAGRALSIPVSVGNAPSEAARQVRSRRQVPARTVSSSSSVRQSRQVGSSDRRQETPTARDTVAPSSYPSPTAARRNTSAVPRRAPYRPLVGDGGRLFGNGRLINSTRRLLGL